MTVQVLTPQNFTEFVQTGKVAPFVSPDAKAPPVASTTIEHGSSGEAKGNAPQPPAQPRGADGKFTPAKEGDTTTTTEKAAKTADAGGDEGDDDLPEAARKRIGKKHRQMKEAEEFASSAYRARLAADARAEKAERELSEMRAKSQPATAPKEDKPPKPEDFATAAEYTEALVEYRVAKRFADEATKAEQKRVADEKAAREREFAKRMNAAKTEFPDFEEVLQSLSGTELDQVPGDVIEYMQESEFGPKLIYHLGKNPDVLERFRKLSPRRFIAELGKLEASWEKPPAEKNADAKLSEVAATAPTAVSKAPAPIQALGSEKSAVVNKDPATMNFQELREYDRQQRLQARR